MSKDGHSDSFLGWVTLLVHRYRTRLVRIARREGLRADDALDCVQDAFMSFLTLPQARMLVDLPDDSARTDNSGKKYRAQSPPPPRLCKAAFGR